jgi:hypothetical protein
MPGCELERRLDDDDDDFQDEKGVQRDSDAADFPRQFPTLCVVSRTRDQTANVTYHTNPA